MKRKSGLLDVFALALLWGPSFLFIKLTVGDITPLTVVALRISIGAFLLFAVLYFKNIKLKGTLYLLPHCFVIGILAQSIPFVCFNYSLQTIPSSLSALINGSTPLLTIVLAGLCLKDEPITWSKGVGIVLGILGFMVLFLPVLLGANHTWDPKGMLLSFIGASGYAIGMIYAKKYLKNAPPLVAPMLQLLSSLIYLIPIAFIYEDPIFLLRNASFTALSAVFGLGLMGTTLAYMLYYRIIEQQGATAVSMVTYLLPIIGTLLGVVFLNEPLSLYFCIAAFLILCGVLAVNGVVLSLFRKRMAAQKDLPI